MKCIFHNAPRLITFLLLLKRTLTRAQRKHLTNMVEALLCTDGRKTLAPLGRLFVEEPDPSTVDDCYRESPWQADTVRAALHRFAIEQLQHKLSGGQTLPPLYASLDDALILKDKQTRHLQLVDGHHDHQESTPKKPVFKNGCVYLACHLRWGEEEVTFDLPPYRRESTVRKLNRQREPEQRLAFRSKYRIARAILGDLRALLPAGLRVYVLFDSCYASAKWIKFCRRQRWHVICALKSNRKLDGQAVRLHAQRQRHPRYQKVKVVVADETEREYLVRAVEGHLQPVPFAVRVLISRRHQRDKKPKLLMSTDLSLSAHEARDGYGRRWGCE